MAGILITTGVAFARNIIGLITRPYETYRRIVTHGGLWELVYIGLLLTTYFATAVIVKTPGFRPYILTRQFVLLGTAVSATLLLTAYLFWFVGRLFGAKDNLRGLLLGWAYSLVPTWVWFWMTSLLFVILPPPRTPRPEGIAFSVLYLVISSVLFFWKVICSYLTIRFALKLDLLKNIAVCAVVLSMLVVYSFGMYMLGIFRIPFI